MTTATTARSATLFMAVELSNQNWRLAFSNGQKIRQINCSKGQRHELPEQIQRAKGKLGLPADGPVCCCYEAGRDGFWVHRFLTSLGLANLVVDSASIEVNRRQRRAKNDRLDAEKLVRMLMRYHAGETKVWQVVRVPAPEQEDQRRPQRELQRLQKERTAHRARLKGLLALHGIRVRLSKAPLAVAQLRDWQGQALGAALQAELQRQSQRLALLESQIQELEKCQEQRLRQPQSVVEQTAARLGRLRALGPVSSWLLSSEFFAWRHFQNRREVGALAGLCGTPYDSGQSAREQGISKAGNKRVRWVMIELAWGWLRWQPDSELSQWYGRRFGQGTSRQRRIGIVALARKLLVALWKYLDQGLLPAGARLK